MVEVAVRRGLVTPAELETPALAPAREEYGPSAPNPASSAIEFFQDLYESHALTSFLGSGAIGAVILNTLSDLPLIAAIMFGLLFGLMMLSAGYIIGRFVIEWSLAILSPSKFASYLASKKAEREFRRAADEHRRRSTLANIWQMRNDVKAWTGVGGREFESLVGHWFAKQGYKVTKRGGAGDGGVDLIVEKDGAKAIVQCKAYSKPLAPAIARELWGTLQHTGMTRGYLATLHGVSSASRTWLEGKPITVLTLNDFLSSPGRCIL